MTRVVLNPRGIADLGKAPLEPVLQRIGDQVAARAAQSAPKDTGAGARSIRAETEVDGEGAVVKVSWDNDHFYMLFSEVGTSKLNARPFLRPALDGKYTA